MAVGGFCVATIVANPRCGGYFLLNLLTFYCPLVRSPQTNGICERFPKTVLDEFYRIVFRKKIYPGLEELQADLEMWLRAYNEERCHQGRWGYGKTPMQTFVDTIPLAKEKWLAA